MSSRIQSSKQGRELRNSRGRLPSSRSGEYDLFQARLDTRKERIIIGSTASGPTYRERPPIITETPLPVSSTSSETSSETASLINTEIIRMNQELKYQAEQHKSEIQHLKSLIEQTTRINKKDDDTSKQALFQQEIGYTLQELSQKIRMMESNIQHLEKDLEKDLERDSGDPVIVHHEQDLITNRDIVDQLRENITRLEDNMVNVINKVVDPKTELLKESLNTKLDVIQEVIDTIIKTNSSNKIVDTNLINEVIPHPESLNKEEVIELINTILTPIKNAESSITIKKTEEDQAEIKKSVSNIETRIATIEDNIKLIPETLPTIDIESLKTRIATIEDNIKIIPETLPTIDSESLKTRIATIEDNIKLIPETLPTIDIESLKTRIATIEDNIKLIPETLPTIDIESLKTRIATIEDNIKLIPETLPTIDIESLKTRIATLSNELKMTVNKSEIDLIRDSINKLKDELKTELQTNRQSSRNESAERERDILKEQRRISDKLAELETKITGRDLLKRTSTRDLFSESPPVQSVIKNEVVSLSDDETKKRLAEIEEKIDAIQKKPSARSVTPIQRRSQSRERELDGHRLRDVPVFSAELRETMVVKGDVGPIPLINDSLWNIIADTTAGFDYGGGYYECPITGAYSINLICKTLSTSVTLKITLVHIDSTGHILKAYSLDQSNMINEHSMTLRLPHAEKGDRLKFLVESRFNIALKGHEVIEVKGEKYPIVSTLVQVAYTPPVGFCES